MASAHGDLFACGWATIIRSMPIRGSNSFTERLEFRTRAWIELAGCVLFALPYTASSSITAGISS